MSGQTCSWRDAGRNPGPSPTVASVVRDGNVTDPETHRVRTNDNISNLKFDGNVGDEGELIHAPLCKQVEVKEILPVVHVDGAGLDR